MARLTSCGRSRHWRAGRKLFLCLMQKPGDGQLVVHSRHGGNDAFLHEVVTSFSAHAPAEAILVIKQHPLDYAIEHSQENFERLVEKLGLADRIIYLRKTSIDKVMPFAFGVLTINSTAGLASDGGETGHLSRTVVLRHRWPDLPGRVECSGEAKSPDPALTRGFIDFLKSTSQINGGFHTGSSRAC